ncbi:serine/threonine-protein phosphatase 6 regulatory ankyrin repeat subunit C-like [Haliotis asinina]|uniref:serine/threonine-protein phosphatase 6 regulatory ankyrin repeat subunit C-like n=1 Tax=Haliotis asinina TaxID=109174 RepID=UPI003531A263
MDDSHLLHVASSFGEKEEVLKLIRAGHDINAVDEHKRTPVTVACEQGHYDIVNVLIDAGCDLNFSTVRDSGVSVESRNRAQLSLDDAVFHRASAADEPLSGEATLASVSVYPPLHAAVSAENETIVKALINSGRVDVNCMYLKQTPLIIAAKLNCQNIVGILIEAGAHVNFDKIAVTEDGVITPIHYAVVNGNYDMVKYLIDNGASYITELPLNVRSYRIPGAVALRYYGSLIELACQNNQLEILVLLINTYESDITFLCKHYALLWSCQMEHKECLDILLLRLYNTECELNNAHLAQNHQQILRIALRQNSGKDEVIPLRLLEHFGPKMFTDSTSYYTTLYIGVLRVFPKFVKAMLVFHEKFPKTEDEDSVMDICYSALNGVNLSILKDLYEVGLIDVKYIDQTGENAAFNVVQSSRSTEIDELIQWLSDLGVDFTKKNNKGLEPIHTAVGARTCKTIAALVRQGVNIDSQTSDGQTPLHLALNTGWELERSIVKTLLDAGADPCIQDNQGRTPVTMFVLSYFNTFHTGQTWCMEKTNGWRWALELLVGKLGCFLYNVHVIGFVEHSDWWKLWEAVDKEHRLLLQSFPSLQTLCWSSLRQTLGGIRFCDKVEQLPLPQPMKIFLKTF